MKANDNVHAVRVHSIIGDSLEPLLLVTTVQLRARNLDPSGVGGRDSEKVDTNAGKLVNSGGVQE